MDNWKDIAQCFLDANFSISVVPDTVTDCFKTFTYKRTKNKKELNVEVFEFISSLFEKYLKILLIKSNYETDKIIHNLIDYKKKYY